MVDFHTLSLQIHDLQMLKALWKQKKIVEGQQEDWKEKKWKEVEEKTFEGSVVRQEGIVTSLPGGVSFVCNKVAKN